MSIPPLVCSTPPPPDQCEEDKDPEDFDITYNLSQDEDDDYNFGNFPSYTNIQTSTEIKNDNVSENIEILTACDVKKNIENIKQYTKDEHHSGPNITTLGEIKCGEDTNIEDLELEISEKSIENSVKVENEVINVLSPESSVSEINVGNEIMEDHLRTLSPSPANEDDSVESFSIEDKKQIFSEDIVETPDFELDVSTEPRIYTTSNSEVDKIICIETLSEPKHQNTNFDKDFGDFDEFQYASTENNTSPIIDNCSNPWESNEIENDDFGNFTANFETVEESKITSESVTKIIQTECQSHSFRNATDEDDFEDFDDFKSSAVDNDRKHELEDTISSQQGPGIDFHLSDNESQVMESITNVLCSIFEEEVTEPESEFDAKLETMLSETWRHLRETDVRQPYILNWNNSLGQKTLLRALCIDSRNILFGPKWSCNMPKYAVNLSNAPLQPQKPLTPSCSSQSETVASEKITTKPGGWVDPFTSDGQESCNNAESESVVEVTPSDLDVLEAAILTKSDNVYSSTLNVQPLRQINLPDTHIFTPTDSETPRSKTIHYDSGPPVLLPQPVVSSTKSAKGFHTQNTETNENNDEDDWEFQDFKGSAPTTQYNDKPIELNPENISKPNLTYQTQVLQPIKMKPLMPSLNWPDPGEVKETFEDFSDFVSNTPWNNEQSHITSPQEESKDTVGCDTLEKVCDKHSMIETKEVPEQLPQTSSESFDDEFDTFQSALPPKNSVRDFALDSLSSNTYNNIPTNQSPSPIKDFDYTFPKYNNNKSDAISVENTTIPSKALTQSLGFIPTPELTSNKNLLPVGSPMSSNLLQPLAVNSNASQKHQKTAQILQPLSLESYSQINWPNPGIDLQDLSRFNPVETLESLKTEVSAGGSSKGASPIHVQKNAGTNQVLEDDIWGEFVSSKPKQTLPKKAQVFVDDDEWTDFVSSPSIKPQNGLNTISLNVHTNSNIQKSSNLNKYASKNNKAPLDIPTLNYITPKSSGHSAYNERHFQNL